MLQDSFSRQFQYIRISVTERCNFKCQYCLPNGYQRTCADDSLFVAEIDNLVAALVDMGVWKIRLTGGEPTLRRDLSEIMQIIRGYPQIRELGITTNGFKLGDKINEYFNAGLTNLNVSVDSMDGEQFKNITQVDKLDYIMDSIKTARSIGVCKIKINAVLLPHSLTELDMFLEYIRNQPISVRFIELMQTSDNGAYFKANYIDAAILHNELLQRGWQQIAREDGAGPAIEFSHTDYIGKVGIIAPYRKDFCSTCNRLRFTHTGALRLCLFGDGNYPLRNLLQSKQQKPELQQAILVALSEKPKAHQLASFKTGNIQNLSNVGG
ncbi:MAG: 3,8-cyclase MoaA [Pseudomonadota bacterium]|nr:3,8-cyclase MoaA [Pseudomonadota bacterium]